MNDGLFTFGLFVAFVTAAFGYTVLILALFFGGTM